MGESHHQGQPDFRGHHAYAGKHHFILPRQASQRTGAGHIGGLVAGGSAGDAVVELVGVDLPSMIGLTRAGRDAESALDAGVVDLDTSAFDMDRALGAHVDAAGAGSGIFALATGA